MSVNSFKTAVHHYDYFYHLFNKGWVLRSLIAVTLLLWKRKGGASYSKAQNKHHYLVSLHQLPNNIQDNIINLVNGHYRVDVLKCSFIINTIVHCECSVRIPRVIDLWSNVRQTNTPKTASKSDQVYSAIHLITPDKAVQLQNLIFSFRSRMPHASTVESTSALTTPSWQQMTSGSSG